MKLSKAGTALLLGAAVALPAGHDVQASSHREAPFIAKNPKVDATDFYMFKSYESGRDAFVTIIANYQPLQDAYGGPNYFPLDDQALYEIEIDNTGDAKEDITFQFRFQNALNGANGIQLPIGTTGNTKNVSVPLVNIGSPTDATKLNVAETYTVKVVTGNRRTGTAADVTNVAGSGKTFTKPTDFIGKKSYGADPAYANYAATKIYDINIPNCATAGKMFVGQRAEPFAVNLGVIFDLVNATANVVTGGMGRDLAGANVIGNKNITSIALEIPASCIKGTGDVVGAWTTASVRQARVINPTATYTVPSKEGGAWTQVSRLGMPLVNEVVIGLKDKDRFNSSEPKDDAQFADYVTNPTLPTLLEILFGSVGTPFAPTVYPRTDLVTAFLTGVPGVNGFAGTSATAEMLRLNISATFPAAAKGAQNSLGAALCFVNGTLTPANTGCDPNGFPNGRRPGDDVVDIALRVVMGYLFANDTQAPQRNTPFTDGALQVDTQFGATFPYLNTPNPGA